MKCLKSPLFLNKIDKKFAGPWACWDRGRVFLTSSPPPLIPSPRSPKPHVDPPPKGTRPTKCRLWGHFWVILVSYLCLISYRYHFWSIFGRFSLPIWCKAKFWMKNRLKNEVEYRHRFSIDFWSIFGANWDGKSTKNRSKTGSSTD